jgi:hypothetical protein
MARKWEYRVTEPNLPPRRKILRHGQPADAGVVEPHGRLRGFQRRVRSDARL